MEPGLPMRSADEIKSLLLEHLDELRGTYGVIKIGLFGSYCRGEQNSGSDIDLLVEFSKPVGFVTFLRLEKHLEQILDSPVDLVTRQALKPHIGQQILKEVRYVY